MFRLLKAIFAFPTLHVFTAGEISDAGKIGLDFYVKNQPIDQVGVDRPLFQALSAKKKSAPGAKQYVIEQLRVKYQSNFQWFNGAQVVTYNKRQTIDQTQFAWRGAHDGFALDEDRLIQNGITVTDSGPGGNATDAERLQLTNLLEEQMEVLRLGFQEKFSQALHLDGTQSADALTGMDALISLTPTTGTVGGLDRSVAANAYWRNNVNTALDVTTTTGNIIDKLEIAWRACIRNGGKPDVIVCGSTFYDGFRNFMFKTFGRIDFDAVSERVIEGGARQLTFHGVPLVWSPEFLDLDTLYAPATAWEKRCYFVNSVHMRLRPMEGQDMISRKPPRPYDRYEYYWAITWRGALTINRGNAFSVNAVA